MQPLPLTYKEAESPAQSVELGCRGAWIGTGESDSRDSHCAQQQAGAEGVGLRASPESTWQFPPAPNTPFSFSCTQETGPDVELQDNHRERAQRARRAAQAFLALWGPEFAIVMRPREPATFFPLLTPLTLRGSVVSAAELGCQGACHLLLCSDSAAAMSLEGWLSQCRRWYGSADHS